MRSDKISDHNQIETYEKMNDTGIFRGTPLHTEDLDKSSKSYIMTSERKKDEFSSKKIRKDEFKVIESTSSIAKLNIDCNLNLEPEGYNKPLLSSRNQQALSSSRDLSKGEKNNDSLFLSRVSAIQTNALALG